MCKLELKSCSNIARASPIQQHGLDYFAIFAQNRSCTCTLWNGHHPWTGSLAKGTAGEHALDSLNSINWTAISSTHCPQNSKTKSIPFCGDGKERHRYRKYTCSWWLAQIPFHYSYKVLRVLNLSRGSRKDWERVLTMTQFLPMWT